MTTMITGGTGLIGFRIAKELADQGERPVVFDYAPAMWRMAGMEDKVDVVRGNVVNLNEIIDPIKKYKVRKIIHLASLQAAESSRNPLVATMINNMGTLNVYEAARLMECERVCAASSIACYGSDDEYDPSELPLTEDAPAKLSKGVLAYAAAKVYMEALGRLYRESYGTFVCGLRPSIVYGWGRTPGTAAFAGEIFEKAARGEPVELVGGNTNVSMVYNDDVVGAWMALLDADKSRFKHFFYNTGGDTMTVQEIGEAVKRVIPDARITILPGSQKYAGGLPAAVSDEHIVEELGFTRKFTPIEAGIEAMLKDVRDRQSQY
jgi:nucleoside-diphosphate-sugar epimerase